MFIFLPDARAITVTVIPAWGILNRVIDRGDFNVVSIPHADLGKPRSGL